jgi:hypothetical protein
MENQYYGDYDSWIDHKINETGVSGFQNEKSVTG